MLTGTATLNFGTGDIHIVSSCTEDGKTGYVVFENHDQPRKIGKNPDGFVGEFTPDKYPIIMTFKKTESIDALIGELLNAKENMVRINKNGGGECA
jgi:hypothetical protein